jgi:argininosuccinate lyase
VEVFRVAHYEMAPRLEVTNQAAQNAILHGLLEIDHDIAAKNGIERPGDRPGGIHEV